MHALEAKRAGSSRRCKAAPARCSPNAGHLGERQCPRSCPWAGGPSVATRAHGMAVHTHAYTESSLLLPLLLLLLPPLGLRRLRRNAAFLVFLHPANRRHTEAEAQAQARTPGRRSAASAWRPRAPRSRAPRHGAATADRCSSTVPYRSFPPFCSCPSFAQPLPPPTPRRACITTKIMA